MYHLTEEERQALASYLGSRPYAEVVQLISLLAQLPKCEKEKKKK